MKNKFYQLLESSLEHLKEEGLYKNERVIDSPQRADIDVEHEKVINLCANNYLGLADNPSIKEGLSAKPR